MSIQVRNYNEQDDYQRIDAFLTRHYQPNNADGNWIEPAWEYIHYHPLLSSPALSKSGIWEDDGEIVGAAHIEWQLGEAFFQFHPDYPYLRQEMLDYAEEHLSEQTGPEGSRRLCIFINDFDQEFQTLAEKRGYKKNSEGSRPMSIFNITDPFPPVKLPDGFHIVSLADEPDWAKVNRVMWRGFNHDGEPPDDEAELESRRHMFETPNARMDLKIAVAAPNGNFVSFCGMFYEPVHQFCYVEPVATDPDYRKLGLGKAAVLEGIRRCRALGACAAYVGSDQPFYLAIGFHVLYQSEPWCRDLIG